MHSLDRSKRLAQESLPKCVRTPHELVPTTIHEHLVISFYGGFWNSSAHIVGSVMSHVPVVVGVWVWVGVWWGGVGWRLR